MSFFKSLVQRWQQRRHGNVHYQRVRAWAEEGDDDELMRMATEADAASAGFHDSSLDLDIREGDLDIQDGVVFSSSSGSVTIQRSRGSRRVAGCLCRSKTSKERISCVWMMVSLFIILAISALSISLGYYALFVLKPEPVIDKSVESFNIPDHKAYIHYDALSLARRYNATRNRFRRDVDDDSDETNRFRRDTDDFENDLEAFRSDSSGRLSESASERSSRLRRDVPYDKALNGDFSTDDADSGDWVQRVKRSSGNFLVDSQDYQVVPRWKMQVIYLAVGDSDINVFTEERLKMIHKVEQDIVSHPRWNEFCLRDPLMANTDPAVRIHNGCAPLNSLLTYFFPSEDENKKVFYDGYGENLGDVKSALKLAMNHETFYYFVDTKINQTYQKSHMLRTEVLFGAPLPGFTSLRDKSDVQSDKYKEFIITYIDVLSKSSTDKVHVLYGGNELFDYEVETTFWNDVWMAIYAVITITIIMLAMTSFSFILTFMGLWCIVLAFPLAIFFYRVVFNIVGLGIMNGAAAFVIIGIGVDDVFVFINIFRQSTHLKSVTQRLKFTIRTAGVATFATSITTAVSYAANIAGSIPAVYEFGLFMSLIVAGCWINVFLIMPSTLYLHYFWFQPLEDSCSGLCCRCLPKAPTPTSTQAQNAALNDDIPTPHTDDDDDVPLLQLENDDDMPAQANDDALLIPDHPEVQTEEHMSSSSYMGRLQQAALSAFVDKLVIQWRYVWMVVLGLFFVGCVGMASQLQPSDHPPQLFKPDTNLQRLLDLKANFTMIDDLHCDHCSAIYNLKAENVPNLPPTPPPPIITSAPLRTTTPHQSAPAATTTRAKYPWFPWLRTKSTEPTTKTSPNPSTEKTTKFHNRATTTTTHPTQRTYAPPHVPIPYIPTTNGQAKSTGVGYDPCKQQNCENIKSRPMIQSGATVYVVFGITGVNRTGVTKGHVLTDFRGIPSFDDKFADAFDLGNPNMEHIRELCKVCTALADNTNLVKNGSAQCLPRGMPIELMALLNTIKECQNLPKSLTIYHHEEPSHAEAGINHNKIIWLAFAFESTVSKGESYFEAYKKYQQWEAFITHIKKDVLSHDSPLQQIYQTSEHWRKVMMEVVAVDSAVFSVVLSFVVCMCSIVIFTGHFSMLFIVFLTIVALIALVVAIFFMSGWQMGAVEAVSLSILVGSSVDYCMHLAEGYLLMGKVMPPHIASGTNKEKRHWRTVASVRHIGSSILSSALTTIMAAIPLTQTTIQPFAKFGKIVLINSSVSIIYTLTLCVALLATIAPASFVPTWKSHVKAVIGTAAFCCAGVGILYGVSVKGGLEIPGPNGSPLFQSE